MFGGDLCGPAHRSSCDVLSALQLAVSPDGRYAFALVYGASGAFFTQANLVVVDIRSAHSKRVRRFCTIMILYLRLM
jgi:hypothetical protein